MVGMLGTACGQAGTPEGTEQVEQVSEETVQPAESAPEEEAQNPEPADGEVARLPELVYEELDELMAEQAAKYRTKDNVVPMLWQGLLEMEVPVEDAVRTVKIYVPEGTPQGASFVIMNVPEGQDTVTFMKDSGWTAKAEEEEVCLFVLEPDQSGSWGTLEEEMAYVNAASNAQKTGKYLNPGPCRYMVGYGEIGSDLQKFVMENPLTFGGAVFLDASRISGEYLASTGESSFDTDIKTYGVTRKEVPVPVKIIEEEMDSEAEAVAAYWKDAAADENAVDRFAPEGAEVLDAAVVTEEKACDYASPSTTDMIWEHMGQFHRYGNGVLSNSIYWKVDYDEMGVEFKSFTDAQGKDRQYMFYIPAAYRDSDEKLPLVIAWHGAGNSMRNHFENTLWYRIADQEGIILVFPEATLGTALNCSEENPLSCTPMWQPDNSETRYEDADFARDLLKLLEQDCSRIDTGRIYCTGHSAGCMMTSYLGSTDVSDQFAAVGGTSGGLMDSVDASALSDQTVPAFLTMGEYDLWTYDLSREDRTSVAADMWLVKNGLATGENVAEVRVNGASETYDEGRYHNSVWKNADGIPLFRYAWVTAKDHANLPEENQMLWDEWLSQYTLDPATGIRTWQGEKTIQ